METNQSSSTTNVVSSTTATVVSSNSSAIKRSEGPKTQALTQNAEVQKNGEQTITSEKLKQTTDELNSQMEMLNTNVRFAFSEDINALYIQVTEKDTGRVIRTIPSEEAMKLASHFKDAIGLLYDKEG